MKKTTSWRQARAHSRIPWYAGALGAVIVTTGLAFMIHQVLPHASLSLLFLTGILVVSARMGWRAGLAASVLSFLAYNFFYTPPQLTFKVDDDGDVATLLFFLIMAAISGNLAARMHREMRQRQESLQRISRMFEFVRRLSSSANTRDVLDTLAQDLADQLKCSVFVWTPSEDAGLREASRAGTGAETPAGIAAEAWRRASDQPVELEGRYFLKLNASGGPAGLVALDPAPTEAVSLALASSFCDQAAIALDRTLLASDLDEARLDTERERLRSTLLSSLSHDLRTPLASVIGSTSSVLEFGPVLADKDREELLQNSLQEALRLDRYIQNLLDMTRLGQGALDLDRNWVDIHDIVSGAAARLGLVPGDTSLAVDIAEDFPMLWVNGALIEQALVNLLDNAMRFSPEGGTIALVARSRADSVTLDVVDEGPGIPEGELKSVFDMFHTVGDGRRNQGTGLGLAICQGIAVAHGGRIDAEPGPGGSGTRIRITLPRHAEKTP